MVQAQLEELRQVGRSTDPPVLSDYTMASELEGKLTMKMISLWANRYGSIFCKSSCIESFILQNKYDMQYFADGE